MEVLLARASVNGDSGEVPVAAVILDEQGQCIGHGRNRRERCQDPLGHAELVALSQAATIRGDWRFNPCTLLVTLEPCPMCAGALVQARMGTVVFGASDRKRGGLGGCINLADDPKFARKRKEMEALLLSEMRRLEDPFRFWDQPQD